MQSDTLLLRQIHPNWVRESRVTSVAFCPTPKDDGKLSVSDGTKISPQESWEKHTLRFQSAGTMAVTVDESEKQQLLVEPNPLPDQEEHVLLDFVNLKTHSQIKSAAKMLAAMANKRDWLYRKT
jgi:hypothetical protein